MNNSFLDEALNQIASNISLTTIYELKEIDAAAKNYADEITTLFDFEPEKTRIRITQKEINRYLTRIKLNENLYELLFKYQQQSVTNTDIPIDNVVFIAERIISESSPKFALLGTLTLLLSQMFIIGSSEQSLYNNMELFNKVNQEFHKTQVKCLQLNIDIYETINVLNPITNLMESVLFSINEFTRADFCKKELRRSISWSNSLLNEYKKYNNKTINYIEQTIRDAEKIAREPISDNTKLFVSYQEMVTLPYHMLSIIQQNNPNFKY